MKTKGLIMKTRYYFLTMFLFIALTFPLAGQPASSAKTRSAIKKKPVPSLMGKAVYEATVDSLTTRVWIVTQKKHANMMKTMQGKIMGKKRENTMDMDHATRELMTDGTHYLHVSVTNNTNQKIVADTSAKVEIFSPSKKMSSVILHPMMDHFGGGVVLDEKGEYLFTINLNVGMGYQTTQFKYAAR